MTESGKDATSSSFSIDAVPSVFTSNDMHDRPEERASGGNLPLDECDPIASQYRIDDALAESRRARHRRHTYVAAVCGMVAILAAICELALGNWPNWPPLHCLQTVLIGVEFAALVALAVAVLTEQKYKWLLPRQRAELYRLAKFEFLTTPAFWQKRTDAAPWVKARVKEIEGCRDKVSLKKWETKVPLRQDPSTITDQPVLPQTLQQLIEYYLAKRLIPQKQYFKKGIDDNQKDEARLHRWPRRLFVGSVIAAALHLIFDLLHELSGLGNQPSVIDFHAFSLYLALLAACLPAVAAGVRTVRSAFEFQRNRSRFLMARSALQSLESQLNASLKGLRENPESVRSDVVLKELWWCEHILQIEHYEWHRLMIETEWYG